MAIALDHSNEDCIDRHSVAAIDLLGGNRANRLRGPRRIRRKRI